MKIERLLKSKIKEEQLGKSKLLIVYGARRTGKTTLVKELQDELSRKTLFVNCDLANDRDALVDSSIQDQASVWKDNQLIIIDEAQRKKNIGIILKIAIDNFPDKDFIVTGSSSLDLSNEISEPLTGRTFINYLYPISQAELINTFNKPQVEKNLENYLVFGSYPELLSIANPEEKKGYLLQLANDYLYKDVLQYQDIRKPDVISKLLKLLAYQIGSEVSFHELATILGIDQKTVVHYLDLLEKSFVIFRLSSFSRNLRKEINSKEKIYFCDLGVRNALIGDFNSVSIRQDVGGLWENFIILERLKKRHYRDIYASSYFWRTYDKVEIDLVEDLNAQLFAYEIKCGDKAKAKEPKSWRDTYPDSKFLLINKSNYLDFIT